MELEKYILEMISSIEKSGFEAYIVGGAIRDRLLNIEPKDYDIATNALPRDIEKIFNNHKIVDIGKKYGTIMVIYQGNSVEITTYRSESNYIDGRRPEEINFTDNLEIDLSRRDFTVNAMSYNPKEGLIDLYGGLSDLKDNIIRTVNDPYERLSDDYLRIMRAIRFCSQLNFKLEAETYKNCILLSKNLNKLSPERIRDEFFKILMTKKPSIGIELMRKTGALEVLFPEVYEMVGYDQHSPFHHLDLYEHSLVSLDNSLDKLEIRIAALFHDLGKVNTQSFDENGIARYYNHQKESVKIASEILKRLNSSNKLIDHVSKLIDSHMIDNKSFKEKGIKRLIRRIGRNDIFDLLALQRADRSAIKEKYRSFADIDEMEVKIIELLDNKEVYEKRQLAINGRDVIKLGYKEGKIIGEILDFALEIVLEDPSLNDKEYLLKTIKENFRRKYG